MSADSNRRVLVVDDDDGVREVLCSALRLRGVDVDNAAGGQQALDLLRENQYSLVILDLLMPQPDGFAVLDSLDGKAVDSPPVVLVVTGADRSALERLDARRVHGIMRKPCDPDELASIVVACTEIRSRAALDIMAMAMISSSILDRLG